MSKRESKTGATAGASMVRARNPIAVCLVGVVFASAHLVSSCGRDRGDSALLTAPSPAFPGGGQRPVPDHAPPPLERSAIAQLTRLQHFYPLTIGNSWSYDERIETTLFDEGGNAYAHGTVSGFMHHELIGNEVVGGVDYVVERDDEELVDLFHSQSLYRQDHSGLFQIDPWVRTAGSPGAVAAQHTTAVGLEVGASGSQGDRWPGESAVRVSLQGKLSQPSLDRVIENLRRARSMAPGVSGGPLPTETALLRYPLLIGARWVVRDPPGILATVERMERINEPAGSFAAIRIRIDSGYLGLRGHQHVWYGHAGFLRFAAHLVSDITDSSGAVVGTAVSDWTQDLSAIHLARATSSEGRNATSGSNGP